MVFRKLAAIAVLVMVSALGACNLSSQFGAANEVALNPPTLQASPSRTPIPSPSTNPTRTAFAAPTITVLGGGDMAAAQPASQSQNGGVTSAPTQAPPEGVCSLKPTGNYDVNVRTGPGAEFKIMSGLQAGQYVLVIKQAENGWFQIPWGREAVGWVSPKVVTLYGPCSALSADRATEMAVLSVPATPTGMFGFTMNIPLNHIITKVDVGSIPAGTTVVISTSMFTGSEYLYEIVTVDGRYETAHESQLTTSKTGGKLPFPTPTPYVFVATPTAFFNNDIGMGQYRLVTTTQVGDIPAGTVVSIGSAMYNGQYWTYAIATQDGKYATASESQLAYIPNAGGGPTPTVPVMYLPTDVSPSDVVVPDGLCTVIAKSKTNLYAAPGSSTVVGVLNPGPWAQVGATDGQGWYKVTIWTDGRQGWTTTATVQLYGPCDALPIEQTGS